MHVEIKTLPALRLAYLRHTGPCSGVGIARTWERFTTWCTAQGLMQPRPRFYGISQDNPATTPPAQCRYDACVAVGASWQPEGDIGVQTFPGGRYACARFTGPPDRMGAVWDWLYREGLPSNGLQAQARPGVEIYEEDFAVDPATGAFSCWVCVAVR